MGGEHRQGDGRKRVWTPSPSSSRTRVTCRLRLDVTMVVVVVSLMTLAMTSLTSIVTATDESGIQVVDVGGEEESVRIRIGGFVGCLFDAGVCLDTEDCYNDNLFGSCRKSTARDDHPHRYSLDSEQADSLALVLERLIAGGHNWRHLYTQCILTSFLLELRGEASIDSSICETSVTGSSRVENPNKEWEEDGFPLVEEGELLPRVKTSENHEDEDEFLPQDDSYGSREDEEDVIGGDIYKRTIIDDNDDNKYGDNDDDYVDNRGVDYVHPWSRGVAQGVDAGDSRGEARRLEQDIDEILSGLTDKQLLDVLDKLIANIDEQQKLNDAQVKKSSLSKNEVQEEVQYIQSGTDPATITTVVVDVIPGEENPADDDSSEENSASQSEDGTAAAQYEDPYHRGDEDYPDNQYNGQDVNYIDKGNSVEPQEEEEEEQKIEIQLNTEAPPPPPPPPPQNRADPAPSSPITSILKNSKIPSVVLNHVDAVNAVGSAAVASAAAAAQTKTKSNITPKVTAATGSTRRQKYVVAMFVLCGVVGAAMLGAIIVFIKRRHARFKEKMTGWSSGKKGDVETTGEYQDLCRQHMQSKLSEKSSDPHHASSSTGSGGHRTTGIPGISSSAVGETVRTSSGSSTSSWSEEPVTSNMDISTGHLILSYMENHLQNKDRLQKEWDLLCAYDAEPCSIVAAIEPINMRKNRYTDILPYEHCRVKLNTANNVSGSDYINANNIMDHDPRNPAYIATQGPLPHTVADFWQMIWEQGSVVIVNLTRLVENSVSVCNRYWPEEGSDLYHIYEVHLVSEHTWCEDYLVRSFYLKNLQTNETRTITQFHFLSWPNLGVPGSTKVLLDFRRKVNRSYKGRSCPVVVHCSDGAGRTGTYCLIDLVLNRLSKGAKEIDIAATLEHIRDQRVNMVRTKEQFEFALAAVAQEVHTMLQVTAAP